MDGMATRRRIEEVRGAAMLSIGPEGPVSLPRDSSETLALLLSRSLLCAERDDHATGRPLVYRPTTRLLQLLGAGTLEEAKGRMGVPADYQSQGVPTPETGVAPVSWTPERLGRDDRPGGVRCRERDRPTRRPSVPRRCA